MAGGVNQQQMIELRSRPGHNSWIDRIARVTFITLSMLFIGMLLIAPMFMVLSAAFSKGWSVYVSSLMDDDTRSAIKLTLTIAVIVVPLNTLFGIAAAWVIVVPLNTLFGIAAAWAIAKFEFRGKALLGRRRDRFAANLCRL